MAASRRGPSQGSTLWAYTWDVADHLLKVTRGGANQGVYAYDGTGRMVESIESSSMNFFAYYDTEMLWRNVTDYLYAGGMRIAKVYVTNGQFNTVRYYHDDIL